MDTQVVFLIAMLEKTEPHGTVANYQLKSGLNDVALPQISRPEECNLLATAAKWRGEKMFAVHIINNIYIFYSGIINDNTLSSFVPIFGGVTFILILQIRNNRTKFESHRLWWVRTRGMQEAETSMTEALWDTCCAVNCLHLTPTLVSGSFTYMEGSQTAR